MAFQKNGAPVRQRPLKSQKPNTVGKTASEDDDDDEIEVIDDGSVNTDARAEQPRR